MTTLKQTTPRTLAAMLGVMLSSCTLPQSMLNRGVLRSENTQSSHLKICASLEGNGENFSSHFGAFVALMERGLDPVFIAGGSSGAPVAALVRLLLENPSLAAGANQLPGGSPEPSPSLTDSHSKPRQAAKILAASVSIFEALLFLPALDDIWGAAASLVASGIAIGTNRGFVSNPDYSFAHAEAITAQLVMAAGFFATHDFSEALAEADFKKRVSIIRQAYIKELGMMAVTPEELVNALLTSPDQANSDAQRARDKEIRRRYFFLFDTRIPRENRRPAAERLATYENQLARNRLLLTPLVRKQAQNIYFKALELMKGLPFVGALAATVGRPFLLPNPEVLGKALDSKDAGGNIMGIPNGTLVHTTARLGESRRALPFENTLFPRRAYEIVQNQRGRRIDDKPGFPWLYQFYFTSEQNAAAMNKARASHADHLLFYRSNLADPMSAPVTPLEKPENAQVFSGLNLHEAITATISEPGVFRRIPISMRTLKAPTGASLPAELTGDDSFVITYGGWLDTSASQTLALLPECAPERIGYYVYLHPNRLTNEFQRNALVETNNRAVRTQVRNIDELMAKLGNYLTHSRNLQAKFPSIDLNWNWDNPVPNADSKDPRQLMLKQVRPLYLFAAYQAYQQVLEQRSDVPKATSVFGDENLKQDVMASLAEPAATDQMIQAIYGSTLAVP